MNTLIKETGAKSVRIAVELMNEAETAAKIHQRSLSAQVEHWARIGAAIDGSLNTRDIGQIKTATSDAQIYAALTAIVAGLGAQATLRHLKASDGPIYEEHPTRNDLIVRIQNGHKQAGRFLEGTFDFVPEDTPHPPSTLKEARDAKQKKTTRQRRQHEVAEA
jgi:ParD-like antitoxin of type II bacterial toxin-antitoxin system